MGSSIYAVMMKVRRWKEGGEVMIRKFLISLVLFVVIGGMFGAVSCGGQSLDYEPPASPSTLEVANLGLSDLRELRGAMVEVLESADTIANEEEKTLLTKAKLIVDGITFDAEIRDLIGEKTEEDRLKLDFLGKAFAAGVIWWAGVFHGIDIPPSPVLDAIPRGAEELGNRIGAWLVLGQTGYVKVTDPDSGIMDVLYETGSGVIWAQFQVYEPVGYIYIRVPVEPVLVSAEGQGNIILSEGIRPIMENCRIAYRFGEDSELTSEPMLVVAEEWQKTFGGPSRDEAYSVQQTSDGGFVIAGGTESYGAGKADVYLVKTNANGNEVWSETFGGSDDDAAVVQQTSDGGFVIAGGTESYGAGSVDFYLVKTDRDGNGEWSRTFGGPEWDVAYSVQQTSDGGFIIAGETDSYGAGGYDVYLVKTDANGNKLWSKTFGGSYTEEAFSVQQTSDGGFIVAGYTNSYGAGRRDVYLVKADANGNKLWSKTFGGFEDDYAYSVQQTSDGGFIIAGETESYGAGGVDVYLVKTDRDGNSPSAPAED